MIKIKKSLTMVISTAFIVSLLATTAFAYHGGVSAPWSAHFNAGESKFLATGPIEGSTIHFYFGLFSPYYATLYVQMFSGTTWANPISDRYKCDYEPSADYWLYYNTIVGIGDQASLGASNSGGGGTQMSGNLSFYHPILTGF